jgi:uncharacterized membrane protein
MLYLLLTVQVLGAITLYYWFFFNGEFFYLLNKHKKANPLYLFFLPLGFIAYPAVFALAYKLAWDYHDKGVFLNAFLVTIVPVMVFLVGIIVLRKIKSL